MVKKKYTYKKKSFPFATSLWRAMVNFWTFVLYVVIIADFFLRNKLGEFLGPISALYIASLALYSAEKEFERWHDYHESRHPGEMYVIIWTILIIVLLGLEVLYHSTYTIPNEIFSTYVVVIGVLAITKRSKHNYDCERKK